MATSNSNTQCDQRENAIQEFLALVGRMRNVQKKYFEARDRDSLTKTRDLEARVDQSVTQLLSDLTEDNRVKVLPTHLHHARTQAALLRDYISWDLGLASTGLVTIGKMLHLHSIDGESRLTDQEVEGLCLIVEALGKYVGCLQGDLTDSSEKVVSFIESEGVHGQH